MEKCEAEKKSVAGEHKLALRRIDDLQAALSNEFSEDDLSDEDEVSSSRNGSLTG